MKVILYTPDFNKSWSCGHKVTHALSEGLKKLGIDHSVRRTRNWERDGSEIADVCIVNGWWKKFIDGRTIINRNVIINAQEAAGKPAWCIERGFLLDRELWSGFSIGGFCSNGGDFRAEGMPSDRWDKMDIELKPWRTGGDYILLCAQVPWDAQVQDGNHLEWLIKTIGQIRKHTSRPIKFRGHPKAWRQNNPYGVIPKHVLRLVDHEPLNKEPTTEFEEDLVGAHSVVCYNSNVATLSTIAGVPVITGADCLADPIACREICMVGDDEPGYLRDHRQQWANDLAYKQWHIEEFREALPWLHLMR